MATPAGCFLHLRGSPVTSFSSGDTAGCGISRLPPQAVAAGQGLLPAPEGIGNASQNS